MMDSDEQETTSSSPPIVGAGASTDLVAMTIVGVDVGGTFTDLVAITARGDRIIFKEPSTPRAPEEAVLVVLTKLLDALGASGDGAVGLLCHSTTVATNALLGQLHLALPRVGLITTMGFRDVLEIGRQARAQVYDLGVVRPRPLAARHDRHGVTERVAADGTVATPLDEAEAVAVLRRLESEGVRDVAVVFLHSYANPLHERRVAELAAQQVPALVLTLSSEVDPAYREYERTSTTVTTAALKPIVSGYLARLAGGVHALGVAPSVQVMGSHGGLMSLKGAQARPAALIESGPAVGLSAAAGVARRLGIDKALSFDMGGTTAKAGAILDGAAQTVNEFEAAGATHSGRQMRGSGYPVRWPVLDLAEVSAGGGTIAHLDAGGALRVGPLSAGADPGPACYGRGGGAVTVTDANLLLGRLDEDGLLGGTMTVDRAAAEHTLAELASPLGMTPLDLSAGIVRLIDAAMARALHIVSVERGHDPRRFTLIAFGGGGPLHACAVAAALGVARIVIPAAPGLFSAAGLLTTGLKVVAARPALHVLTETTREAIAASLEGQIAAMDHEARAVLAEQGATDPIVTAPSLDMRYAGQSFELAIPVALDRGDWLSGAVAAFHARHEEVYGYASPLHAVEVVTARLAATAPPASLPPQNETTHSPFSSNRNTRPVATTGPLLVPRIRRSVFFEQTGLVETPIYDRDDLPTGSRLSGPAVVAQYDATTLLHPGWTLEAGRDGDLLLSRES